MSVSKVPKVSVRMFSSDQFFLDKNLYSNSYGFSSFRGNLPVIVDIGAHCGYFSFAAMAMGAKSVYAFEPYIENYRILLENLTSQVKTFQIGAYVKNENIPILPPKLVNNSYIDYGNLEVDTKNNPDSSLLVCLSLDNILTNLVKCPVDILKINIGYAEIEILDSAGLEKVQNICGETEAAPEHFDNIKKRMLQKGFLQSSIAPIEGEDGKCLFKFSRTNFNSYFKS